MRNEVTVDAVELKDVTVSHISLVKRGANRVPFRVVKSDKQESSMINIDLSKVMKGVKALVKKEQSILGVVVTKSEDMAPVEEALKTAGFSIETPEAREDGTVIYKQSDEAIDFAQAAIVKMSDDLLVVMKGFDPYSGTDAGFMSSLTTGGFYPSIGVAFNSLHDVMLDTMMKAASPQEAKTSMSKALSDFSNYVLSQVENIPSEAFKADKEIELVIKSAKNKAKDMPEDMTEEEMAKQMDMKNKAKDKTMVKSEEPATEEVAAKGDEVAETQEAVVKNETTVAETIQEALAPVLKSITQQIADVASALSTVTKQVSDIAEAQKVTAAKMDEVEAVAKESATVLKTVVIGGEVPDDQNVYSITEAKKSADTDPRTGAFDSAFLARK